MATSGFSLAGFAVAIVLVLAACQKRAEAEFAASGSAHSAEKAERDSAAAAVDPSAHAAGAAHDPSEPERSAAAGAAAGRYLPAEQKLLSGNSMSVEATRSTLMSDDFDASMAEFAAQAARDPNARDLSASYRAGILRQLGENATLIDVQCGLSLCMGAIRTKDRAAADAWSERFAQSPDTPNFVFTRYAKKLASGGLDNRFVFSSDPGANSVTSRR